MLLLNQMEFNFFEIEVTLNGQYGKPVCQIIVIKTTTALKY
jgi:hypothetical protein